MTPERRLAACHLMIRRAVRLSDMARSEYVRRASKTDLLYMAHLYLETAIELATGKESSDFDHVRAKVLELYAEGVTS